VYVLPGTKERKNTKRRMKKTGSSKRPGGFQTNMQNRGFGRRFTVTVAKGSRKGRKKEKKAVAKLRMAFGPKRTGHNGKWSGWALTNEK